MKNGGSSLVRPFDGMARRFLEPGRRYKSALKEIFGADEYKKICENDSDLFIFYGNYRNAQKHPDQHGEIGVEYAKAEFVFQAALAGYELDPESLQLKSTFSPEDDGEEIIEAARAARNSKQAEYSASDTVLEEDYEGSGLPPEEETSSTTIILN